MQGSVQSGVWVHSWVVFIYCFTWIWSGKNGLRRERANSKGDLPLRTSAHIEGYVEEALSCNAKLELSIKKKKLACGFLKIIWANVYLLTTIYAAVHNLAAVEQNWFLLFDFCVKWNSGTEYSVSCRVVVLAACKSCMSRQVFKLFKTGEEEETGDLSSWIHQLISCLLTCSSVICVGGKITWYTKKAVLRKAKASN